MTNIQDTSLQSQKTHQHHLASLHSALFRLYTEYGALTDKEAARLLETVPSTVSGVRYQMVKSEAVERTDDRRDGGYLWRLKELPPSVEPKQQPTTATLL